MEVTIDDVELAIKILEQYLQQAYRVQRLLNRVRTLSGTSGNYVMNPQKIMDYLMAQTLEQTTKIRKKGKVTVAEEGEEEEEPIITEEELKKFRSISERVSQEAKTQK